MNRRGGATRAVTVGQRSQTNLDALSEFEFGCGRATRDSEREQAARVNHEPYTTGGDLVVRLHSQANAVVTLDRHDDVAAEGEHLDGVDVELTVAEVIDPEDFADELISVGAGLEAADGQDAGHQAGRVDLGPEIGHRHPTTKMRSSWREHIATIERRTAYRGEKEVGVAKFNGARRAADHPHRRGKQTVVWTNENRHAVTDLDGDRAAVGADAGVDDREHHPWTQIIGGASKREPTSPGIELRDAMTDVDHTDGGRDRSDHRMDDPDELVGDAEIGEEGDRVVAKTGRIHALDATRRARAICQRPQRRLD